MDKRFDSERVHRLIVGAVGPYASLRVAREHGVYVIRVRDEAVSICMPYAQRLAADVSRRIPSLSMVESDDIEAAAMLGLVEGVDSFEPRRGVQIQTHLWHRIRKRINEERVVSHWRVMRPPIRQAERYLAKSMDDGELCAYLDRYVVCRQPDRFGPDDERMSWDGVQGNLPGEML